MIRRKTVRERAFRCPHTWRDRYLFWLPDGTQWLCVKCYRRGRKLGLVDSRA